MNQVKSDHQIQMEGRTELLKYLKDQRIFFSKKNIERIDKRIQINMKDLGLNSYSDYLELIKKDEVTFNNLIQWLKRGKIYDDQTKSFSPLIKQKRNAIRRVRRTKRKESNLKHIEPTFVLQFPDPQDIEYIPKLYTFLASNNINHKAYKEKYFLRRIWSRMMRNNATSYQGYLNVLKKNPGELNELLDTLSINVTRFFRDIDLFKKLDREVLPQICGKKNENIRIWSAGCAVGAEAYSLAIMIAKIRKNDFSEVKLFATDICQDFLNRAKKGIYSAEYLSELSPSQIAAFFKPIDQGLYQIDSKIRNSVTFKQHDLRTPPPTKELDLILCRNVLIYFSQQESESLFQRFHSALKHDGYLVLGKCELIHASVRHLFTKVDSRTRIYRRA
ncbi:MAG: CheR family methyltransferase [Candidatus Hodarchaeales archaeon]|jgi:chemotaxis protein methyltransferase CheR